MNYLVAKGDSFASVAKHFDTTVNVIREMNDLPGGALTVGTGLRVPSPGITLPPKVLMAALRVDRPERSARRPHVHIVRRGDSLMSIARRTGVDVNALAVMNNMRPGDPLRAGQRIKLSRGSSASASGGVAVAPRKVMYTVRDGDTLRQIAKLFQVSVTQIMSWNGIVSHASILPGQKLTIRVASRRG
jgi:LysM repeat protein